MSTPDPQTMPAVHGTSGEARGRPLLCVISGPDAGAALELTQAPVLVGTAPEADLRLADPQVSRRHLEIRWVNGSIDVKDLGSTNGTWLGGSRIAGALVPVGGAVCLGGTRLSLLSSVDHVSLPPHPEPRFGALIGVSLVMRRLFSMLGALSNSDVTVLLLGETGTGKDAIARELHAHGPRAKAVFTVVDCAAVAPNLIESELFGHEKGAFTGAQARHAGAFERSNGGTVLLDEIGELPLELQPRLLRVLEERTVQRVGGTERLPVDVRFVAATHRDLPALVHQAKFRSDLYYRVSVAEVRVPALRERPEDIPALVSHLAKGSPKLAPGPETLAALQAYDWPGNVRELRNAVERAAAFGDERLLTAAVPRSDAAQVRIPLQLCRQPYKDAKRAVLDAFEREYVGALLQRFDNNFTQAAKEAEMDRNHLAEIAARHELPKK